MAVYAPQTDVRLANLAFPLVKRSGRGSVTIYDEKLHRDLTQDVNLPKHDYNEPVDTGRHRLNADVHCDLARRQKQRQRQQQQQWWGQTSSRPDASCSLGSSARSRLSSVSTEETITSSRQLDPRACLKVLSKSDPEFRELKQVYENLLEAEIANSMDMEHFLLEQELLKLRKRETLHRKWTENVYDHIMRSVYDIVYPQHSPDVTSNQALLALTADNLAAPSRARLRNYSDYLSYVNKRGFAFLDTCQPSDYCPLPQTAPAETRRLRDPTLKQERDRLREKADILRCMWGSRLTDKEVENITLPKFPSCRSSITWKNHSNAHLSDVDSPSRCSSRLRMCASRNSSTLDLTFIPVPPGNFRSVEKPVSPSTRDSATVTVAVQTSEP